MGESFKDKPWWKPAFEVFSRVSAWVIVPIVGALILGKYLDGYYGTKPWIFLVLSCIGFLISSFGIVYTIRDYLRKMEANSSRLIGDQSEKREKNDKSK